MHWEGWARDARVVAYTRIWEIYEDIWVVSRNIMFLGFR